MKKIQNKTITTLIALFLILNITLTLAALPVDTAHSPPWDKETWTYCAVSPISVGLGQTATIIFWLDTLPQTAQGDYGDRFTFTLEVTKPDGSNQSLGTIKSDPVGGGYTTFTPDQVGNYSFVAKFPGHKYTGTPQPPFGLPASYLAYINDTLAPSTSEPAILKVQVEPIAQLPVTPLPTDYWTRPIDAYNRDWSQIAGNWLSGGHPINNFNQYTTAPETAHVVWTRPFSLGGIMGGEADGISYYTGASYETFWGPPIIMQGRLYYNVQTPPRIGWYCIDIRTGEELWFQNSTGPIQATGSGGGGTIGSGNYPLLSFGQVLEIENPNQHGGFGYLWSNYGTTWQMYDAFTGNWICNIDPVPSGSGAIDEIGSRLVYVYNSAGWLALWNSTRAIWYDTLAYQGNNYWTWRPFLGRTFNGTNGYEWNVTAPKNLGSITSVLKDRLVGTSSLGSYGTNAYSVWAVSLKAGQQGTLMWKKDYAQPPVKNGTMQFGLASLEENVFTMRVKETRQWYGYNLDTGNQIWGPAEAQDSLDMYSLRFIGMAYGKEYTGNYGGKVWAVDVQTGETVWSTALESGGLEGPYPYWPIYSSTIADGKLYVRTDEHSHTHPLYKGWKMYCIDAETGEHLWNFTGLWSNFAIADGYAISLNGMDSQIYSFGKGQTATTVTASPEVSVQGSSVLVKGTVLDQSPGAKDTPAIADQYMTEWMEYLYKQHEKPTNAVGVEVTLDVIDSNGNFRNIGTTTSDSNGFYSYGWKPDIAGIYTVIASFNGTKSYFPSHSETAFIVDEAPAATDQPGTQQQTSIADTYLLPGIIGIIVAIAIVGVVLLMAIRKRP